MNETQITSVKPWLIVRIFFAVNSKVSRTIDRFQYNLLIFREANIQPWTSRTEVSIHRSIDKNQRNRQGK